MLISSEYLEINRKLHEAKSHYGTSGHLYAKLVRQACEKLRTKDVLDYGCGKRTLEFSLGRKIKNYDPAIQEFAERPEAADIVVCTDVLEHVEPECLECVLLDIHSLSIKSVILGIHLKNARKTLPDGRNAHLIVKPPEWWDDKLRDYFVPAQRELLDEETMVFIGSPLPKRVEAGLFEVGDGISRGFHEFTRHRNEIGERKGLEIDGNLLGTR